MYLPATGRKEIKKDDVSEYSSTVYTAAGSIPDPGQVASLHTIMPGQII
jgi:hypothetical protein